MQVRRELRWWPLAMTQWACRYNAIQIGKDGYTPWERRFGEKPGFVVYPFGALVLFKPAGPGIRPVDDDGVSSGTRNRSKKWRSRLAELMPSA